MATLEDVTRWQREATKVGSTTLDVLIEMVAAIESVGEFQRYWPREMRLDGTDQRVEEAVDKASKVIKAILGEE